MAITIPETPIRTVAPNTPIKKREVESFVLESAVDFSLFS